MAGSDKGPERVSSDTHSAPDPGAPPSPQSPRGLEPVRRSYIEYQDAGWLRGLFRPFLIALVSASLAAGPLAALRVVLDWRLTYALPLTFIAAAEGVYSTLQRGRPQWRDRRGLLFRLGELALLLVVLRLAEWLFATGLPSRSIVVAWLHRPESFLDTQYVITSLLILLAWGLAVSMTVDFLDLAIQPDEIAAQENRRFFDSASDFRTGRPSSRADILGNFMSRWARGGILLVVLAASGRVNAQLNLGGFRTGLAGAGIGPDIVAALICYFLGGLLLISQARLAVLRGGWFNDGIVVAPAVLSRWHVTGVLSLLVIGAIAAFLPLGSTTGMALVLQAILGFLLRLFFGLFILLMFLFSLLLYPFRFLTEPGVQRQAPQLQLNQVPRQEQATRLLPPWLGGAVFWIVVVVIVVYLALIYLRAHAGSYGWLDRLGGSRWARLFFWWRARWSRLRRAAQAVNSAVRSRLGMPEPAQSPGGGTRIQRPGRLPPRARIRYFYLSTLRRASQRGFARPPHKTPLEFIADLRRQWPDAEEDLEALTDAFVEARYDARPVESSRARSVEPVWTRAMRALGRRGLKGPGSGQPPRDQG